MKYTTADKLEFLQLTDHLPYRPKAIFPSEMFFFWLYCRKWQVDGIIESGTGFGGSLSYLCALFPHLPIVSVDNDRYGRFRHIEAEIKIMKPDIRFLFADARVALPFLISAHDGKSLAILIDGPKQKIAFNLMSNLLKDSRVSFIAVHDLTEKLSRNGHSTRFDDAGQSELDRKVGAALDDYPNGPGLTFFERC